MAHALIHVRLGQRSYPIYIGSDMLSSLGPALRRHGIGQQVAVITDTKVGRLYLAALQRSLRRHGFRGTSVTVPSGEHQKALGVVQALTGALLEAGVGRDGAIIALGGGVIGDLAGFVAATYLRGVPLVHVPTTLLAQVDSSIGGKVGVNHPLGKNMIGAFHQPRLVWSDASMLRTLPRREAICGLGEVLKYGIIRDPVLFAWVENNLDRLLAQDPAALHLVIRRCASIKARITAADEREHGLRMILNHGHTIGHALEAAGSLKALKHGEAVLLGMAAECIVAHEAGLLTKGANERIQRLISRIPVPHPTLPMASILRHLHHDKKNVGGKTRFVLPTRIGRVRVVDDVDRDLVKSSIRRTLERRR